VFFVDLANALQAKKDAEHNKVLEATLTEHEWALDALEKEYVVNTQHARRPLRLLEFWQ
jgi:hypothetical protein